MACLSVCVYGLSLACVYGLSLACVYGLSFSMCIWLVFQYVYMACLSVCVYGLSLACVYGLSLALPSSMALEGNSSVSSKCKVKNYVLVEHTTICPITYRYT